MCLTYSAEADITVTCSQGVSPYSMEHGRELMDLTTLFYHPKTQK